MANDFELRDIDWLSRLPSTSLPTDQQRHLDPQSPNEPPTNPSVVEQSQVSPSSPTRSLRAGYSVQTTRDDRAPEDRRVR